MLVSRTNF